MIEDGAAGNGQRSISADGKAIQVAGVGLDVFVELELAVGDDSTSTTCPVFENAIVQSDDGSVVIATGLASRYLSLLTRISTVLDERSKKG